MMSNDQGWYTPKSFFLSVTLPFILTVLVLAGILIWRL